MLFTSPNAKKRNVISFADEFFGGKNCPVDVKAKVLYRDGGKRPANPDIIWQYEAFARAFDVFTSKYGRTLATVEIVIKFCKDNGILVEYLTEREKEVKRIMMDLLSQEGAVNQAIAAVRIEEQKKVEQEMKKRKKAEQERKKAEQECKETKRNVFTLVKKGKLSLGDIPLFFPNFSADDIKELKEMLAE